MGTRPTHDDVQSIHEQLDNLHDSTQDSLPSPGQMSSLVAAFLPSHPPDLRSKAYVVLSAFCHRKRSSGKGKQGEDQPDSETESLSSVFQPLIASRLSESNDRDVLAGLSFLCALFQVDRKSACHIFEQDGFVDFLSALVISSSPSVALALARLLAQASGHKSCRPVIPTEVIAWIQSQYRKNTGDALRVAAALALIKLSRGVEVEVPGLQETSSKRIVEPRDGEFAAMLKEMTSSGGADSRAFIDEVVEGLAYLSVNPAIKQSLGDVAFLTKLFDLVPKRKAALELRDQGTVLYGILVVISNLCAYRPRLSQEEKQVAKLRDLTTRGKRATSGVEESQDPLDDDAHVLARCRTVTDSKVHDVLTVAAGKESPSSRSIVSHIYLSLVEDQKNRGKVLQGGGAKNLGRIIRSYLSTSDPLPDEALIAIQALAKLAITSSPVQVFGPNEGNVLDAISRFSQMLLHCSATTLQQFEAMMALTNLASFNSSCASRIASPPLLDKIELLMLEDHTLVRRASCELICNLIAGSDSVFARYGEVEGHSRRLKILLAMSDIEDLQTRIAASGALAMLTGTPSACRAIFDLQRESHRAFLVLSQLIDPSIQIDGTGDESPLKSDPGLIHRGVVCFRNILDAGNGLPRSKLREEVERAELNNLFVRLLKGELGMLDAAVLGPVEQVMKELDSLTKSD